MHSWSKQTTVKQSDQIILNAFLQTGKKKEPLEVPTMTHRICQTLAPMWWLALTVCIFPSTLPRRKARLKLVEILVPSKVLIHLLWETYVALDSLWGPKLHCLMVLTTIRTEELWGCELQLFHQKFTVVSLAEKFVFANVVSASVEVGDPRAGMVMHRSKHVSWAISLLDPSPLLFHLWKLRTSITCMAYSGFSVVHCRL